jgi:hypothetical protein
MGVYQLSWGTVERTVPGGGMEMENRENERDDADENRQEDIDNAMMKRRDLSAFDYWPSDEQMEYFKRGGR